MPPLLADFIHPRVCKPICEKSLTLPLRAKDPLDPLIVCGDLPQGLVLCAALPASVFFPKTEKGRQSIAAQCSAGSVILFPLAPVSSFLNRFACEI